MINKRKFILFQSNRGPSDVTAPTLVSATVEDASPNNIVMVFIGKE